MNTGKKFAYGLLALVVVAAIKTCHDTNSGSSTNSNNSSGAPVVLSDADRAAIEAQAHADAVAASPTMTPEAVKAAAKRAADAKAAAEAAKAKAVGAAKAEAETAAAAANTAAAARLTAKIPDWALDKYTKDEFPKLYNALGKKGVKEAEAGAKAAALKAALSDDCKSVEAASVSMETRSTKHMEFFVNCDIDPVEGSPITVKQWRFKASELKDAHGKWLTAETATGAEAPGESDTDKNLKAQEAERNQAPADYSRCEEAIKAQLDYPSSADFHYLAGRADFVNPQNENVIRIDFEAKNGFGNMLPFVANCIFKHNGKVIADIYKR